MIAIRLALVSLAVLAASLLAQDDKAARKATYRVTGMFRPDREADFREAMKDIPDIKLVSVDYKNAEATFEFVPAKAFPGATKPGQVVEQLDNKVRQASNHTFGVRASRTTPREKLKLVEIRVAGCNCKACDLAAYEIVAGLPGVEQATASFAAGRVTALIDPAKTDRAKLVEAMKAREVDVKDR